MTVSTEPKEFITTLKKFLEKQEINLASAHLQNFIKSEVMPLTRLLLILEKQYALNPLSGSWHMFMLEVYLKLNELDQCVEELKTHFAEYPNSQFYSKIITGILNKNPQHAALIELLNEQYQRQVLNTSLIETLASMYVATKNYEEALKIYESVFEKNPQQTHQLKIILDLNLKSKKWQRALEVADQLLSHQQMQSDEWLQILDRQKDTSSSFLFLKANAYIRASKPDLALQSMYQILEMKIAADTPVLQDTLKKMLEAYPEMPEAELLGVRLEIDAEHYSEAVVRLNRLAKNTPTLMDQIIQTYLNILKLYPGQILARQSLSEIYLLQNHYDSSLEQLSQLLEHNSDSAEWVIARVKKVLKKIPDSILARGILAKAYLTQSQFRLAMAEAQHLLQLNPHSSLGHEILGKGYAKVPDSILAKKHLTQALQISPYEITLHSELENLGTTELDALIIQFTKQMEKDPYYMPGLFELGKLYFRRGFLDEAIAQFQLSSRDADLSSRSHHYLGICYKEKGRFDLAVVHFKKALETDQGRDPYFFSKIEFYLGLAYEASGEIEHAIRVYEQTSQQQFSGLNSRLQKLKEMDWTHKRGRALSAVFVKPHAKDLILCWSRNNEVIAPLKNDAQKISFALEQNNLGVGHALKGRLQVAEQKFKTALDLDSGLTVAFNNWAMVLLAQGDMRLAHEKLQIAVKLNPQMAVLYANQGVLEHMQKNTTAALNLYQKALGFDDTLYTHQINYGDLLYELHEVEKAIGFWERALYLGILPELAKRRLQYCRILTPSVY
jgi:tetratricopeptide (TPR) repeat protein